MAYPQGFTYVRGPLLIQEFNVASAATFLANMPCIQDSTGSIVESKITSGYLTGFPLHSAANSTPAGKVLVIVPTERTIFASVVTSTVTASVLASGTTGFHMKSGNTFFYIPSGVSSFGTNMYTVVPREDGSTLDSADSSVWLQVNGQALLPFNQSGQPVQ